MDMVSKVSKSVHEALSRANINAYLDMPPDTAEVVARAAIASMREPNEAMEEAWEEAEEVNDHPTELYINPRRWAAAIDAALGGNTDAA